MKSALEWTVGDWQEFCSHLFTQAPENFTDCMVLGHTWTNGMHQTIYRFSQLHPAGPAVTDDLTAVQYLAWVITDLTNKLIELEQITKEGGL